MYHHLVCTSIYFCLILLDLSLLPLRVLSTLFCLGLPVDFLGKIRFCFNRVWAEDSIIPTYTRLKDLAAELSEYLLLQILPYLKMIKYSLKFSKILRQILMSVNFVSYLHFMQKSDKILTYTGCDTQKNPDFFTHFPSSPIEN